MPDTAPARHAGNRDTHGDHRPSSRSERERHFGSDVAHVSHVTIPGRSMQPLCYFLGEKVTQKHFHTAAPLWRQYESAFARSRGGAGGGRLPQTGQPSTLIGAMPLPPTGGSSHHCRSISIFHFQSFISRLIDNSWQIPSREKFAKLRKLSPLLLCIIKPN